ncbi:MAG TPA: hypothetical protein VJ464_01970 [Blastocatellia bacterium]|nr:hypothetical protein [Blastocatellia bacterium]
MKLGEYTAEFADACATLRNGKANQSALIAGRLLENLLCDLYSDNFDQFDEPLQQEIRQREQAANKQIGLYFLERLYHELKLFDAIENITQRSTQVLKFLNLYACRRIRNRIVHQRHSATSDEARFLLNTIEQILAYLGADVDSARLGDSELVPLRYSNSSDCLRLLLQKIWEFPEANGSRASWAVKESLVLRGELTKAIEQPGLGIALFTTELAGEVFGDKAKDKIHSCVDWGLKQAMTSDRHLISGEIISGITGRITSNLDFRHTIALAILMARSGLYRDHQEHYLRMVLDSQCDDGGWPSEFDTKTSELTSTVYTVEYVGICSRLFENPPLSLNDPLRSGQDWLIRCSMPNGGWATRIFEKESWDQLWSTAYILQRLLASDLPAYPEWSQALRFATASLLQKSSEAKYADPKLQLRVEARVAAALSCSLIVGTISPLLRESAEAWLHEWKRRFLHTLQHVPSRECDLATATFASRALLKGKNYREIGDSVLTESQ